MFLYVKIKYSHSPHARPFAREHLLSQSYLQCICICRATIIKLRAQRFSFSDGFCVFCARAQSPFARIVSCILRCSPNGCLRYSRRFQLQLIALPQTVDVAATAAVATGRARALPQVFAPLIGGTRVRL